MTKGEARLFIESFQKLRELVTDDVSLQVHNLYPVWKVGVNYVTGHRVLFNETLYKVLQDHTSQESWNPVDSPSLFAQVLIPNEDVIPEWIQPDSTNTYKTGDKVMFNGKTYVSIIDNNSWSPDEYGWEVVE